MQASSRKQLGKHALEMLVIILGILIAFQVEEWRDSRQEEQDIKASLQRLTEETQENLRICERRQVQHRIVAVGVEQAFLALRSGVLRDQDVISFELGLRRAAELPNFTLLTTVADEMISTGLLKEIDDDALRQSIANLQFRQEIANISYPNRRASIRDLSNELHGYIDLEFVDPTSVFRKDREFASSLEAETQVLYDFEEMATNKRLKNLFFEALDSHADLFFDINRLCNLAAEIDAGLRSAVSN